ncbi:MAG: PAS domain S-box protein, partial [Luteimonas sp.]
MVSGTALCFLLAGTCLLLTCREGKRDRAVVRSAALLLIGIPLLGFIAGTTAYPQALDLTGFHSWLDDGNLYPGRMAPNTRAAFMLAGIGFLLMSTKKVSRAEGVIPIAVLGVLVLGVTGLIGLWLANDLILPWQRARMALPTGIGILAVGLGAWQAWRLRVAHAPLTPVSRIVGSSALILSAAILAAGLSGFATLAGQTRSAISALLEQTLQARTSLLAEAIDRTAESAHFLASSSLLIELMEKGSDSAADATPALNEALVQTLAASEFRAIRVVDPRGRLLASTGTFVESTEKPFTLDRSGRTSLLWNGGYVLRTATQIVGSSQRPLGTLMAERELRAFTAEWKDLKRFGKTVESVLCVLSSATTSRCFPQARNPVFSTAPISVNGKTVPMGLALQGRTGTGAAVDYRGKEVIASFAPVPGTRLGLVIKQDSSEIFAPIRQRLLFMLPMLGALVGVGLWLLRSYVHPLAVNLSHSERAAHEARDLLALAEAGARAAHDEIAAIVGGITDGLLTSDESSKIVSANNAATTMFGYGEGELVGLDVKVLMPPDFRDAHDAGMRRFLRDGTTRVIGQGAVELTGLRRDGSRFPIELSLAAVRRAHDYLMVGVVR